jgi:hypothetical protein
MKEREEYGEVIKPRGLVRSVSLHSCWVRWIVIGVACKSFGHTDKEARRLTLYGGDRSTSTV